MEEWRPICSHYDVSNLGRVKRTAPGPGATAGFILKPRVNNTGYVKYEIHRRTYQGHQLILCGFVGPRPEGMEVNHKDANPLNNQLDNLEYVTRSENIRHAFRLGLINRTGETNSQSILTKPEVIVIRKRYAEGETQISLGLEYRVAHTTIQAITSRRTWRHVA